MAQSCTDGPDWGRTRVMKRILTRTRASRDSLLGLDSRTGRQTETPLGGGGGSEWETDLKSFSTEVNLNDKNGAALMYLSWNAPTWLMWLTGRHGEKSPGRDSDYWLQVKITPGLTCSMTFNEGFVIHMSWDEDFRSWNIYSVKKKRNQLLLYSSKAASHVCLCRTTLSCFNVSVFIRHDSSDHSRAGVWGWNKRSEPMLNYTPTVSVCYLYLEGLFFQHILLPMSSGWLITGLVWGSVSSSSALQLAERRTSNHRLNNYWMSCSVTWAPVAP